jgi:hypothetical protein
VDLYEVWFNLKAGVRDVEFCERLDAYLGRLAADDKIVSFRVTRRKLAFGIPQLGEFHVTIEVRDLAQLDAAFQSVAARSGEVEGLHAAVNQYVTDFNAALYRDFPDAVRVRGQELF